MLSRISEKKRLQRLPRISRICKKNNSCHPVTLEWFSIHIRVIFEIFKPSLTHVRAQIACHE